MKTIILSYVILILVILLVIINSIIVSNSIDAIIEKLKNIPDSVSEKEQYKEVFDDYIKIQHLFEITVSHDDLTNIESEFYEIMGAVNAEDSESLKIAKSRLIGALTHLKRLCGINADSILFAENITRTKSYFLCTH